MRVIYELCCLRNPSRSLGLGAGEPIHIVPISRTVKAAQRVVFGGLEKKLAIAPWFKGRYKATMDYIEFPDKKIMVVGGASSDASALGLNVYSALVDEGNFMGEVKASDAANSAGGKTYDRAQMIYDALVRRVKSRYQRSGVKGMIFLISSKRATDDFTERRIREHIKNKTTAGVFTRDYATWSVKPEAFANQKWYRCAVSSSEGRCRILEDDEEAPEDALVFEFPEDYYSEFQRDPAGCFTGDTKISLLDGSEVPIKDLVGREEFWTYSFTSDGLFKPGRGHSARLTKKNAPLVEVELDNGERIRCTPDHRFMLRNGDYLPALALAPGTSLMPLYRKTDKYGYEMLQVNTGSGRWTHTHTLVARVAHNNCERIPEGHVVHHRDLKKLSNNPENLEQMTREEHSLLHVNHASCKLHTPESKAKAAAVSDKRLTELNLSDKNPIYKKENREAASKRLKEMDSATRHKATMDGLHSRWKHGGSVEDCDRCDNKSVVEQILDCATRRLDVRQASNKIGLTAQGLYYILQREEMLSYAQICDRGLSSVYLKLIGELDPEIPLGRGVDLEDAQMSRKESGVRAAHKHWHEGPFGDCKKCKKALVRPKKVTKPQVIKVTQEGIIYGLENGLTPTQLAKHLGCSIPAVTGWLKRRGFPTYMKLLKDPLLREEIFTPSAPGNHKVVAVHLTGELEDVYDVTVDVTHNFALTCGVVVSNSTRDIGGIATDTYSPFISKRESIEEMFNPDLPHLFDAREWEMGRGLTIQWAKVMTENARGERTPWCCSHAMRHIHIDLSKNMCATGFCIGHQAGTTEVIRESKETGERSIEEAPVFHIDGILRILAGPAGDIDHAEVRGLIYKLNEGGLNIRSVSMDHWMSVPNMQLLKKQGYRVAEISTVKKIDPFDTMRSAIYENRVKSPEYDILRQELRVLELDPKRPSTRPRVIVPPQYCFTGDTRVKLLDGRSPTFRELVDEYGDGTPFHVYTVKDGRVSVGIARDPRLTIHESKLVEVEIDNGEKIRCTPSHKFMLRDGLYREAQSLRSGDSLMPLYTKISKNGLVGYEMYGCLDDNKCEFHHSRKWSKWHFTHRMVGRWKYPKHKFCSGKGIIHHEGGELNNDPESLLLVESAEHGALHAEEMKRRRSDPEFEARRLAGLRKYNNNPENRRTQGERFRRTNARPEFKKKMFEVRSKIGKVTGPRNLTAYNRSESHRRKASEIGEKTIWAAIDARRRSDITIDLIIKKRLEGRTNTEIAIDLMCSVSLVERRIAAGRQAGVEIPLPPGRLPSRLSNSRRRHDVTIGGIINFRQSGWTLKEMANYWQCSVGLLVNRIAAARKEGTVVPRRMSVPKNHKVVSIRSLEETEDVYDLTVDETHNFALEAGIFVHNSKDVADAFAGTIYYLAINAKGGVFLAPSQGLSTGAGIAKTKWKDSDVIWGDEEGYDLLPDPNKDGNSDPHGQAWIV